ncbi:MAG: TadE/TadG family type IV pilus assembly protein [Hyphomonas sp.]
MKRWKDNKDGNISVIFAVAMVPILALVGMAIDLQNTNTSRNFVQYALDNAVIAGSREMQKGKSGDDIKAYVADFLNASIAAKGLSISCSQPKVVLTDGAQDIDISISCSQPTTLTALIGYNNLDFSVSSGSTYGIGKVDVAFVFDVSGSMGSNGKMDALKDAAQDAVDVLLPEDRDTSRDGDVRLAMVSYSSMMNAGEYFEDVTNSNPTRSHVGSGGQWVKVCTRTKRNGKCRKYSWQWQSGTSVRTITNTCIKERIGTNAFTDEDPGPSAWFVPATVSYNTSKNQWDEETCNDATPLPLTYNRADLSEYIESLEPEGGTAGHIGIAWGWYMIAPPWSTVWPSGSDPMSYTEPDSAKAIVLMTDGEFNTWYNNGQGNSFEQAQKFCDNIKDKRVKIYTVAFNAPTAGKEILAYCASSPEFAFTPENASDLQDAYTQIAQSISDLRIRY